MVPKNYVCPTCGYEEPEPGNCPDCGMELEEVCSRCGNAKSECVCELDNESEEEEKGKK